MWGFGEPIRDTNSPWASNSGIITSQSHEKIRERMITRIWRGQLNGGCYLIRAKNFGGGKYPYKVTQQGGSWGISTQTFLSFWPLISWGYFPMLAQPGSQRAREPVGSLYRSGFCGTKQVEWGGMTIWRDRQNIEYTFQLILPSSSLYLAGRMIFLKHESDLVLPKLDVLWWLCIVLW